MSINKNKSEIVESFKNLLKKAEEAKDLDEEKITNNNNDINKVKLVKIDSDLETKFESRSERLGIRSIKRVPSNPFKKNIRKKIKKNLKNMSMKLVIKLLIF